MIKRIRKAHETWVKRRTHKSKLDAPKIHREHLLKMIGWLVEELEKQEFYSSERVPDMPVTDWENLANEEVIGEDQ
jgi:hypothetical protein